MTANSRSSFSAKDEALLILEYLENERMSKTFLHFLDENKHLTQLRSRLYTNYEHPDQSSIDDDSEVNDFQEFFNSSINSLRQTESLHSSLFPSPFDLTNHSQTNDLMFDDDFLNVGLHDLISQTPPMDDHHHDLPDTPVPSVPPVSTDPEEFQSTIEQLFAMPHEPLITPCQPIVQVIADTNTKTSFTKCIVVTQDFLQSMYNQQTPTTMMSNHHLSSIHRPKRRRRRLKVGKENSHQQRKIMPRTISPSHK